MSPRSLDPEVVLSRLDLMSQLLDDLAGIGDVPAERLLGDRLLRHAVERILTQLVELAVAVNGHVAVTDMDQSPRDYRSSFGLAASAGLIDLTLADQLSPSVGMRNVLAHEYVDVDLDQVADAVPLARQHYRAYVRQAAQWLRERD